VSIFIVACITMALAAIAFVAWPLLKLRDARDVKETTQKNYVLVIVLAIAIPAIATAFYAKIGRWNWQQELTSSTPSEAARAPEVAAMIAKLEQRLHDAPNDIDGWLMLGRSYSALDKPTLALNAYQKAYDLSKGSNTDAALGLGEVMITMDERSIAGQAGQLFEAVLAKEPNNPKALWYGAVTALTNGKSPLAHERLQRILALSPPENVRSIIERQLQDIEQQLASAGQTAPKSAPNRAREKQPLAPQANHSLIVQVSVASDFAKDIDSKTPLFILARDPAAPGPPLAAVRRAVGDLPLTVTITDSDAMMQGHGIGSVARVQVVARISKSGAPQAQPGDLFGDATVEFVGTKATHVKIVIDRAVNK